MIDDLAGYGEGAELDADLCVVGAGAAGIAIAREFLDAGMRVLLLESGGLAAEPETDALKAGEADGMSADGLVEGRGRGLGGTTALWAGQCIPLDELDFEERDWVPDSGWPFPAGELAPHYRRAEDLLGVPGESYGEDLWRRWGLDPPALDGAKLLHTYTAWTPTPDLGGSWRRALERSDGVRVLLHANVTSIETNQAGTAFDHVVARSLNGSSAHIRARACVLCAGAIENPRLLLMSGDPEAGGLANPHDNVGRYLQDHPNGHVAVLDTPDPRALQELYSLFYRRGRRYLPKLRLAPEVQRSERVLNCGANLDYVFADEGLNALRRLYRRARGAPEEGPVARDLLLASRALPAAAGAALRRIARGRATVARPAAILLQTHSEQAPNRDSRVTLSRGRDALGSNTVRVEWRLGEPELRTAQAMARTVAAEFGRLGLAEMELEEWLAPDRPWREHLGDSYHHMGTTRMSRDPGTGVVDPDCQVHGVDGLYVAGGSVFPTSGFANPTLTMVAVSLRVADRLRVRLSATR